jgi:tetratricopeptide (TPR) repeat protein
MKTLRSTFLLLLMTAFLQAEEPATCRAGLASYQAGEFAKAQESLWDCVESTKGSEIHALYLALTYRPLKNYESGLARANTALRKLPDNLDLLYVAGYLYYRRNETKESMILATKAYQIAPQDWRVHQLLALNYISFNMLEAAKLSLLKAIGLKPDNAELYYQLARLYFTLGSFVDSIEYSKKALAISPDYEEAYHNLALSYEGSGNVSLAIANFEKAVELDRKYDRQDEWPLIDFAVYQRMGGKPELSIPLLEEALKINPRSAKANYELGELFRDMRQYEKAKMYLHKAVELDPCNARAIYGLAILTRQLGDSAGAAPLFQQFREVDREAKDTTRAGKPCHAGATQTN